VLALGHEIKGGEVVFFGDLAGGRKGHRRV
jgi:hypothetical protein